MSNSIPVDLPTLAKHMCDEQGAQPALTEVLACFLLDGLLQAESATKSRPRSLLIVGDAGMGAWDAVETSAARLCPNAGLEKCGPNVSLGCSRVVDPASRGLDAHRAGLLSQHRGKILCMEGAEMLPSGQQQVMASDYMCILGRGDTGHANLCHCWYCSRNKASASGKISQVLVEFLGRGAACLSSFNGADPAQLPGPTHIVATTTPISGRYDSGKSLCQNLSLAPCLVERFDLVILVQDRAEDPATRAIHACVPRLAAPTGSACVSQLSSAMSLERGRSVTRGSFGGRASQSQVPATPVQAVTQWHLGRPAPTASVTQSTMTGKESLERDSFQLPQLLTRIRRGRVPSWSGAIGGNTWVGTAGVASCLNHVVCSSWAL